MKMDFTCPACEAHVQVVVSPLVVSSIDGEDQTRVETPIAAWCTGSGKHKVTRMERVEPQPKSSSP